MGIEMDKEADFNNTYFTGKAQVKEAKKVDPIQVNIMKQKRKKKMWKPEKLGQSKLLRFILNEDVPS